MLTIYSSLLLILGSVECRFTDVVYTTKGPVQGEILTTIANSYKYSSFKGIPYAEPPIGCNRFKPPIEKHEWSRTLRTTKEGNKCIQRDFVYRDITGDEDCLFLNVYTPHTRLSGASITLKPVIVWLHGASFRAGYSDSSFYGPDFMIEDGVVLVTLNYRIGPLGFLFLDHPEAMGNAGLKDQNLVLKWIQQNIERFGGNPNLVTLLGESAGGVCADYHSFSHMSRGLFHRIISMSASPFHAQSFRNPEESLQTAFDLGSLLGTETTDKDVLIEILMDAPAEVLVKLAEQLDKTIPAFLPTLENPATAPYEEKFLTQCSLYHFQSGDYYQVPYLMGVTSEEALLYIKNKDRGLAYWHGYLQEYLQYVPIISTEPNLHRMMINAREKVDHGTVPEIIEEASNFVFIAGINYKLRLMLQTHVYPIYFYRLNFATDETLHSKLWFNNVKGTAHADDLPYLFYVSIINPTLDPNNIISIVRRRMVRMWKNFAEFGNPTPDGEEDPLLGITWPPVGYSNTHLEITDQLEVSNCSIGNDMEFYETILTLAAPTMGGCVSASTSHEHSQGFRC